jgi:hypothetical protein
MKSFYTYVYLREDGSPYYVGKGTGRRAFEFYGTHRPPNDRSRIQIRFWPDEAMALAYEIYQIDFWGRKDLGTGILRNLTDGGDGTSGYTHSVETRRKLSEAHVGRPLPLSARIKISQANRNRVWSVGSRHKMSASKSGQTHSSETCKKISEAHCGKVLSEETRAKLRKAHQTSQLMKENLRAINERKRERSYAN